MGPVAALRIAGCGALVMVLGWGISIGSVLYNVPADQIVEQTSTTSSDTAPAKPKVNRNLDNLAPDPVIPSVERLRDYDGAMMEPPFVPPPDARHRKWNYWMMCQRSGSLSYLTFAAGLSLVIYALFLWACDRMHWRLGLFRTLGTNSLAAYVFHDVADWIVKPFFPKESQTVTDNVASLASFANERFGLATDQAEYVLKLAFALTGFLLFSTLVYLACRFLERRGWYIRV
jgi:hypothetical protein